jgi:hypothetical protein
MSATSSIISNPRQSRDDQAFKGPASRKLLRTGIITTYLSLRYLVIRGFLDIYPTFRQKSTEDNFRVADKPSRKGGIFVPHTLQ